MKAGDYLQYSANNEDVKGTTGNDKIKAGAGNDRVWGNNGNDVIYGEAGNDKLYGELGNDIVYGGDGADYILAQYGSDKLYGGNGNDNITVIAGGDHVAYGEAGNDLIWSRTSTAGNRTYYGGSGADEFNISTTTWGDLGGKHGNNPLGTVYLPDFNPREGDILSLVHSHDTKWGMGSTDFRGNTLYLSGFNGSHHGLYGTIVFSNGVTEADLARHTLIDFEDHLGSHTYF